MKKISLEELRQRLKDRFPDESFEVIEYESLGKPGKVQCCSCQKIIEVSKMSNFFAKTKPHGCSDCKGWTKIRQEKIEEIEKFYDILETEVKDTHTFYTIKCKECGHVRKSTLTNLFKHLKCGCETGVKRGRTGEEFIKEVNQYSDLGTYSLVGEYVDQLHKVLLRHDSCGMIFSVRPADIIHGDSRCPKCSRKESKGVRYISKVLTELEIPFRQEVPLENSRQRFDFYIQKGNLKIAIEFNGAQHSVETGYFKTTLAQQQERDSRKSEYCKQNNIDLIVIPYNFSENKIFDILKDISIKFNDYPEREYTISD